MPTANTGPVKPYDKGEWLILDSVENAERRKYMLGSVVPKASQYKPFDNYSPHWGDPDLNSKVTVNGEAVTKGKVLQDVIDKLWRPTRNYGEDEPAANKEPMVEDRSVELNDILAGKVAAKTTGMKAAVTDFFNGLIRKHETEQVNIESGIVRRYKIDNPGAKVGDTLMACGPWKEQLQKLFDRTNDKMSPFMLATGIMICDDIKVRWSLEQGSNVDVGARLDGNALLALLHQPPNPELAKYLDTKFEFDREKSSKEKIFATCKHSVILAVRYNYLNLEYEELDERQQPFFVKWFMKLFLKSAKAGAIKRARMGEVVRGRGINAYAHADGTEEEEDDEGIDWFYGRPAPEVENGSGDEHANHTQAANGNVEA
jgi:hypothetical protein